ncbi:MAG: pectinesterase family protein [Armatimonadota bacterium]
MPRLTYTHVTSSPFLLSRRRMLAGLLIAWAVGPGSVAAQTVTAAPPAARLRIVLAGDSTVTDSAGWGGVFAKCFRPDQAEVVNLSRGGRSSRSFYEEGLWKKTLELKPDYVFLQFGHNDQPGHGPERETLPNTTYRAAMERYITEARAGGIQPVLITPLSRRQWKDGNIQSTLVPYADVVRGIAASKKVPLIELHDRAVAVYTSLGPEGCALISPTKPGGVDGTHLNEAGARVFGEMVADEARRAVPALAASFQGNREEVTRAQAPQTKPHPLLAGTMTEPTPQGSRTIVVAMDGSGEFRTIQEAIAAAPSNNADRTTLRIKPGVYQGQIVVPPFKPNLSFVGESGGKTVLTYALNVKDPLPASVPERYSGVGVVLLGEGFQADNITFENTSGDHGQAMAVRVEGDRSAFRNCRFLGWQDTLLVANNRQYFKDCYIEGRVDFIYGGSTAVFDTCQIHSKNGGYVTAASTPMEKPFGYVFLNCRLTGTGVPTYLGRPWRPYGAVAFVGSEMGDHIRPEGWHNWGKPENEKTARYAEYGSKRPGGAPVDLAQRTSWAKRLTADEAANLTVPKILGGWDPNGAASPSQPVAGAKADGPVGFASVRALGQDGTTGGSVGKTVTVRTQAELEKYAGASEPYVIRVAGTIAVLPFGKKIPVASHKTILGVGADATIQHGGFKLIGVSNVILRNLTIKGSYVEGDYEGKTNDFDAIQADDSHHLWIDHCHLSHMGDGILDLRKTSDYITVSWTIISDHNKAFGIGWTPNADKLHVTIHHTWFRNTNQRNPSFDNGTGHLFNNYLENIASYGNYARGRAKLVVENSVFVNVNNPLECAPDAELVARGNIVQGSPGRNEAKGSAFDPRAFYNYTLDKAEAVPGILKAGAGPRAEIGVAVREPFTAAGRS